MRQETKRRIAAWLSMESEPFDDGFVYQKQKRKRSKATSPTARDRDKVALTRKDEREWLAKQVLPRYRVGYRLLSVLSCLILFGVLFYTVCGLPAEGDANNPEHNEVSERYLEQGMEETGAVNAVAGMILEYRAFDTFGESCVLFLASVSVLLLLRIDQNKVDQKKKERELARDRLFEPRGDIILQTLSKLLLPCVLLFGIYIICNGHLSPGGGFSGGAVLGAGMILYLNAFGYTRAGAIFTEQRLRIVTVVSLLFYCLAKSYSFYTGANHIKSVIPNGTPGRILSAGLILPLNLCVGIIVACTIYSFYILFRRGGISS